ncbi:uncharacterized protein CDAR_381571 [Caerostris darwini]|uniref:Uncharacterized protein n=1 Tax=Caerostris darwini TaxID=1538125 RepID=A0AAV4V4K4_9ARAC|nr:uncharacterized protein CDAR_381571 [Caerostris darwini]
MSEKQLPIKDVSESLNGNNMDNLDEFDYSKISDDTDAIIDNLEQLSEGVSKMRMECAVANIELMSKINNNDFERKMEELENIFEEYYSSFKETTNDALRKTTTKENF